MLDWLLPNPGDFQSCLLALVAYGLFKKPLLTLAKQIPGVAKLVEMWK